MITSYLIIFGEDMKKLALISVVSSLLLTACGSEPTKPEPEKAPQPVADCVFPNTDKAAPGWVCDEPVPGIEISAVGIAESSQAGISYMKDVATASARGRLAEQMKIQVSKMVKQYLGTTGVGKTETVDAAASSTLRTVTNEQLVGSKIYKSRTGPNGKLYVLVGIDSANTQKIVENAVKTSMNNDQALWQQFKSKQSFDEMANEISKQKVQ